MSRVDWSKTVAQAAGIVMSYSTGVTLRQLFYRLVSAEIIPNTTSAYKTLSARTAEARRWDGFPSLIDRTRVIHQLYFVDDPDEALDALVIDYRRDRTEGQDHAIYLGVEKNAIVGQLRSWFENLGIPILALGGYSSQTYCDQVASAVAHEDRPAVLIYAGDFDPSGEDIDRDFEERTNGSFDQVIRIALNPDQIQEYNLPPQPGKATDTRAGGFIARHGQLVQVELDALPPDVLRGLYQEAIDAFWDRSKYEAVLEREERERRALSHFRDQWEEIG
jgi:hypothetical protein